MLTHIRVDKNAFHCAICKISTISFRPQCGSSWKQAIASHHFHIAGSVHERRNSIANALELRLSCTNPATCRGITKWARVNVYEAYPYAISSHDNLPSTWRDNYIGITTCCLYPDWCNTGDESWCSHIGLFTYIISTRQLIRQDDYF